MPGAYDPSSAEKRPEEGPEREIADLLRDAYGNEGRLQECADDLARQGYRKAEPTIERFLSGLLNLHSLPYGASEMDPEDH